MILVTGASGVIGTALIPKLLAEGLQVRAMVRDPRRLGAQRVNVQLALGDLGEASGLRQAMRGVDTVIHLAATIRDQPSHRLEEVNALGTLHLLKAAERAGVERFVFFSAIGATEFQRTRFFRSKAIAERAVFEADIPSTVFAPSIVYDPHDHWIGLMRRLSLLPVLPIAGEGEARFEPIWADDAAAVVVAALARGAQPDHDRIELAGPDVFTYEQIARIVATATGRPRRIAKVPLPLVRRSLLALRRALGDAAFATWEEAELMEVEMLAERGAEDARALGVDPRPMPEVLNGRF